MNVATLLSSAAARVPTRVAWVHGDRRGDYATLADRVARMATGLRRLGVASGDRVVIDLPNGPAMVELLFACFWSGAVAVPVNRHLHGREVAYVAAQCGATLVVISAATAHVAEHLPGLAVLRADGDEFAGLASGPRAEMADVDPATPGWLFYTSGTTGRPKGATLTHRNLLSMTISYYADIDPLFGEAIVLHAAPLSHGSGLYLLPALGRGAVNVISERETFDPHHFLDLVDRHSVTHAVFLAPTMLRRLVDAASARGRSSPTLRSIVVGGAALYEHDLADAIGVFGPVITQMYGQGESPMTIAVMRPEDLTDQADPLSNWRSCGRPFTGVEVRIGEPSRPNAPGEPGEICVRADVVMTGYWDDRAATEAAVRDGWLHTGDIGHLDDRGFLYLTDRLKDLIITGGSNVYPREVEEALLTHPAVHEVAVVGYPDPEWGESVRAFVVLSPGTAADGGELIAHCRQRLASFKKPRSVVFCDSLPKSPNGKILKRELR